MTQMTPVLSLQVLCINCSMQQPGIVQPLLFVLLKTSQAGDPNLLPDQLEVVIRAKLHFMQPSSIPFRA